MLLMTMIQSIEDGRKEDGNRSIAEKIIKRLHDLDKTVENNQGRWAWELLQNAKDSIADLEHRKVSIQIELDEDNVEFRHNGVHFTEQDVRGVINQITSKEIEQGKQSKKTGRFGTGFLTTHLLSRIIQVKGVLETKNKDFYSFEFPLDREGKTTTQLIPKIENAWTEFHNSTKLINGHYNANDFNTSFLYKLNSIEQKRIARVGVEEFIKLIPFVLSFIPKVQQVDIIDNTLSRNITFENNQKESSQYVKVISQTLNGIKSEIHLLVISDNDVCIGCEIEKNEKGFRIKSLKDIPKIFCDFPLIGTEQFHFPVVINSFYFNPQTERDGVWLKGTDDDEVQENREIFESAIELFKILLNEVSHKPFFDLFNIVETRIPYTNEKYFDEYWYKQSIQKPLRESLIEARLIELEDENLEKMPLKKIWFPAKSYSEKVQTEIWKFTYDLFPNLVPKKSHSIYWSESSWEEWNKLTYVVLASTVATQENIAKLSETLRLENKDTYNWLNSFSDFLLAEESNQILFEKHLITPNQKGIFKKKSDLYIDEIEDSTLINILKLLGEDWMDELLSKKVLFGNYVPKTKKNIALRITEKLNDKIKSSNIVEDNFVKAISLLSEWFENNKEVGKEHFSELYRRRAELFMNTIEDKDSLYKVMRSKTDLAQLSKVAQAIDSNPQLLKNIEKAEELSNLLTQFNVNDISELKRMLLLAQERNVIDIKSEITEDDLIGLGVTSIEELEVALKDKNLSLMFTHTSTPNVDMFLSVQKLISRAKDNIIDHLQTLPDYDCSELEVLANTVLGGIKKDGLLIHIVIRPSDNGKVIVYYSSEKDTLDYANAELWIDNGIEVPRHLTLGKILKNTGINKIPV
ncbi:conserved hypothetical protein [Cytophaga hutchinsonii ATCC 33406]|uniref:ATP-binding protein n=2 Tax=Cytophaga hutchinsonii TaxID=985 RepID=A0A6N4SUK4_CYTH3|nr:conserved hypothetical protein [Cytophaga hutchinsonii ATCC 33406]